MWGEKHDGLIHDESIDFRKNIGKKFKQAIRDFFDVFLSIRKFYQ